MNDEETSLAMLKMRLQINELQMQNTELRNQLDSVKKDCDAYLGSFNMMQEDLLDILQMAATETLPLSYAQQAYAFYKKMNCMVDSDFYTHDFRDLQAELRPLLEELFDKYHPLTCEPLKLEPERCKEAEEVWKKLFELTTKDSGPRGRWDIHIWKKDGEALSYYKYTDPDLQNNMFVGEGIE